LEHSKHVVILGGGASGCELAAEFADRRDSVDDFTITLLEAEDRLVANLKESTSARVEEQLKELNINIIKGYQVSKITSKVIHEAQSTEPMKYDLLINALGVKGKLPEEIVKSSLNFRTAMPVKANKYGQLTPYKRIWGAGDCVMNRDGDGEEIQASAQAAETLGSDIAENIMRYDEAEDLEELRFEDKGTFIPLGEGRCVLETRFFTTSGPMVDKAWWMFYGSQMPKLQQKVKVMKRAFIKPEHSA
jgi:NADH dehydrogenase FAD-containing subunit